VLSYCSWEGYSASFSNQVQALEQANQLALNVPTFTYQPFPYVFVPKFVPGDSAHYLQATDVSKFLLYAYTVNKEQNDFHFHWNHSPDSQWKTNLLTGYYKTSSERNSALDTPVQKPESLAIEFILRFTNPGDTVVVPFAGSGSEVLACMRTGRKVIAFERDRENHSVARQRVDYLGAAIARGSELQHFRFPEVCLTLYVELIVHSHESYWRSA